MILAIDPGTTESGWALMDINTLAPKEFGKSKNTDILNSIRYLPADFVVIEMISSYGQPVGREVFETCVWIGRFVERAHECGIPTDVIRRQEEKTHLHGTNDAEIKRMLILRFARFDKKTGKGTKDHPDWFFGFKADIWQAYAVGVTWVDTKMHEFQTEMALGEEQGTKMGIYPPFA